MSDRSNSNAPIGILMLDTQFPRPVGDIGNPATYDFPVFYETVRLANPDIVVRGDPSSFLPAFIEAGRSLIAKGAKGISTSCGFLSVFQQDLSHTLDVPVYTSALMEAARLASELPESQTLGILTISSSTLSPEHLRAAGVPPNIPVGTTEGGTEFTDAILDNRPYLDIDLLYYDLGTE